MRPWPVLLPVQRHEAAGGTAKPRDERGNCTSRVLAVPTCDSCGREDSELVAVHRVYVVPESWDTPGSEKTLAEVEQWCFSCRTHYPHQEA
jgi:ribosomal protein L44E